jgi:hypothetical protein
VREYREIGAGEHSLHNYAHRYSMVNPDWQEARLWMRQAKQLAGR